MLQYDRLLLNNIEREKNGMDYYCTEADKLLLSELLREINMHKTGLYLEERSQRRRSVLDSSAHMLMPMMPVGGYPGRPPAAMHVTVEESGKILLSSKVAEKLAKIPVCIQFNQDDTAIQIMQTTYRRRKYYISEKWEGSQLECGRNTQEKPYPLTRSVPGLFLYGI